MTKYKVLIQGEGGFLKQYILEAASPDEAQEKGASLAIFDGAKEVKIIDLLPATESESHNESQQNYKRYSSNTNTDTNPQDTFTDTADADGDGWQTVYSTNLGYIPYTEQTTTSNWVDLDVSWIDNDDSAVTETATESNYSSYTSHQKATKLGDSLSNESTLGTATQEKVGTYTPYKTKE